MPASTAGVRVVQRHHVERHARRAIARRLGYTAPRAVISVHRDPHHGPAVILHVNSGSNAIAARTALHAAGYQTEDTGYDPYAAGHYGVQLRVLPAAAARQAAGEGR